MKLIAKNRRALHDYAVGDKFEAGIALVGHEVKSIKTGHISLKGSFVTLKGGEAYLVNAHVPPYEHAQVADYEPTRSRKLLLKRKELERLDKERRAKGTSIVPLAVYVKRGRVKVEIGIGRGKRAYDKRESIKKREMEREAARASRKNPRDRN